MNTINSIKNNLEKLDEWIHSNYKRENITHIIPALAVTYMAASLFITSANEAYRKGDQISHFEEINVNEAPAQLRHNPQAISPYAIRERQFQQYSKIFK